MKTRRGFIKAIAGAVAATAAGVGALAAKKPKLTQAKLEQFRDRLIAANDKFDPVNYMGEWKWINVGPNGESLPSDPGFFRASLPTGKQSKC